MDITSLIDSPTSAYVWTYQKYLHEWSVCRVIAGKDEVLTVFDNKRNQTYNVRKSDVCYVDSSHLQDLSDLSAMNNLHEAPLINILRSRWSKSNIYTLAGDILISVNPYRQIEGAYDSPHSYFNLSNSEDTQYHESLSGLPPHVFQIANRALRSLVSPSLDSSNSCINQSVVISGESGAGKTEASKYVINFLVQANHLLVSSPRHSSAANVAVDKIYTPRIKDLILESSLIFESFGNAKTVRNDNSSRFGKYIKLQYSDASELISATTETFLLEQSRLISVGENERNYHIFYQMLRGLRSVNAELFRQLRLGDVSSFRILSMGNCTYANMYIDDAVEFHAVYQALYSIGCSDVMICDLWKILACILHLGNAVVTESDDDGYCNINIPGTNIQHIASMLGVDAEALLSNLISTTLMSGSRISSHLNTKPLSAMESKHNINAVIKWLYFQVFSWLVSTINKAHSKLVDTIQENCSELDAGFHVPQSMKFIGILDIFGFEILTVNSFEQLCINYTNERLQQQFNDYVFKSEQEVYAQEGLDWEAIAYNDNQKIIDVIAKKPTGLLHILEEFSLMNRLPDDAALLFTFNQHHEHDDIYSKSRFMGEGFSIKHYAGVVNYKIDGFTIKNNNSLQEDINDLLSGSDNYMLKQMHDTATTTSQTGQDIVFLTNSPMMMRRSLKRQSSRRMSTTVTVSLQFRQQLDHLIRTLSETRPHYIKCIKPNDNKQPNIFNWSVVASQLRYSGVLEVVRIRREGYPIRISFQHFYEKFYLSSIGRCLFRRLYPSWSYDVDTCSIEDLKAYCHIILKTCLKPKSYQIGLNYICLHENGYHEMTRSMDHIYTKYVVIIQASVRRYHHQRHYRMMKRIASYCQRHYRGMMIRNEYHKHNQNIITLRKNILDWCDMKLDTWRSIIRQQYLYDGLDDDDDDDVDDSNDDHHEDDEKNNDHHPATEHDDHHPAFSHDKDKDADEIKSMNSKVIEFTPLEPVEVIEIEHHHHIHDPDDDEVASLPTSSTHYLNIPAPPPPPSSPTQQPTLSLRQTLSPKSSVRFNDVDTMYPAIDINVPVSATVHDIEPVAMTINTSSSSSSSSSDLPNDSRSVASPVSVSSFSISPTNTTKQRIFSLPSLSPSPPPSSPSGYPVSKVRAIDSPSIPGKSRKAPATLPSTIKTVTSSSKKSPSTPTTTSSKPSSPLISSSVSKTALSPSSSKISQAKPSLLSKSLSSNPSSPSSNLSSKPVSPTSIKPITKPVSPSSKPSSIPSASPNPISSSKPASPNSIKPIIKPTSPPSSKPITPPSSSSTSKPAIPTNIKPMAKLAEPITLSSSKSNHTNNPASIIQLSSLTDPIKRAAALSGMKLPSKTLPYYLGRQPVSTSKNNNKVVPGPNMAISPNSTASVSSSSVASISTRSSNFLSSSLHNTWK